MVARVKMSLFLKLIRAHLCILIRKKIFQFSRSNRKFCYNGSNNYNESNNFLFVNATKIYQFNAKDSEIKKYLLCLGNFSGDFSTNNMKKKTGLNGCLYNVSVDYSFLILVILSISINI